MGPKKDSEYASRFRRKMVLVVITGRGFVMLYDARAYFINTNSPSGGTKLMVRSWSKEPRFTQRWKVESSMAIPEIAKG
jgi:hypothetical protein